MNEIDYNVLSTKDEPTSDDWLYSDFIAHKAEQEGGEEVASGIRPATYWDKKKMKVWNQFAQKTTYKGCTAYGLTSPYNGYNVRERESQGLEYKQEDPRWKWEAYQSIRLRPNKGSSLQAMMKFFRERKLIDGNVVATSVQEVINALDNGYYIYTGSNKCNRKKTGRSGSFVYDKNGAGHAFSIVDYDSNNKVLIAINSFGDKRGKDGYFDIPYEDFKYLYSCNVIIDHDNTGSLQHMRDEADIQKAIELGITNGSNMDDYATRREVVLMLVRGLKNK